MLHRARSSQCCGLALSQGLVLHIGLNSLHLSFPLTQNCPRKIVMMTDDDDEIRLKHKKN